MDINDVIRRTPRTERSEMFDFTLLELNKRFGDSHLNLVETGCSRQLYDSGDGWGTVVFGIYARACEGMLWSVDIDAKHLEVSNTLLTERALNNHSKLINSDSVKFLEEFENKIHMLYLDSYDTDDKKFCAVHQVCEARAAINKLDEKALILIDDVYDGIGKAEFSIPFLKANGFSILKQTYKQVLLGVA